MTPLLKRLDKWLSKHRSRFYKNLSPGASVVELKALATALGRAVSADLQSLLTWHNGQGDDYVGYFVDHWLLMDVSKTIGAKQELDATGEEFGWDKAWIPIFDDDSGNYIVLDAGKNPAPVVAFWMGEQKEQLAPSLEKWFNDLIGDVEAGKYCEDPERGTFSRAKQ